MSTPVAKRPPAVSRDSNGAPSPSRTPRGVSTTSSGDRSGTGTAASPGSASRTRSVRSSTLVSARAARRESLLSTSTSANGASSGGPGLGLNGTRSPSPPSSNTLTTAATTEAEETARAETLALLDDLKQRLSKAEDQSEQFQRQNDVLQSRLDETTREHAKLEERTHEYDEQSETLRNEKREMARKIQQMESIYEAERSAMTREKEDMSNREEEMQRVIQRLKDSLAQRTNGSSSSSSNNVNGNGNGNENNSNEDEGRPSRYSMHSHSPSIDGGGGNSFAPPSSLHRSDSRNNSKLLLQKDKLIESLRLELAESQIKLVETENQGGGRLHEVERQLMDARMANARLMEENESYQLLLQEKTLKGDFGAADFGFGGSGLGLLGVGVHNGGGGGSVGPPSRPRSRNQDALAALEGRVVSGSSLADELGGLHDTDDNESETDAGAPSSIAGGSSIHGGMGSGASAIMSSVTSAPTNFGDMNGAGGAGGLGSIETQRRLEAECKSLQDQNKALTLYINKIIERLLEHQDYQYILDKSTDGKQPPPPTGAAAAASALASSMNITDKELPPPPSSSAMPPPSSASSSPQLPQQPQAQQPGAIQSFLQRTKSIAGRGGAPEVSAPKPPRARPVSYMPEAVMSNPDTAPSIPISLGRSTSMRRPMRPMSEQFTGGGGGIMTASNININTGGPNSSAGSNGTSAASVINAMYKGGAGDGPLSPGLRSSQFFGTGTYASGGPGSGPGGGGPGGSGARSPGIGSNAGASGNFPGMRSETSSVSGDSTSGERADGTSSVTTNNSPPRVVHHEKTAFTGTKVRPLRLVQENNEGNGATTPTTNKRASWIGWWGKKDEAALNTSVNTNVNTNVPMASGATTPTAGVLTSLPLNGASPEVIRE